MDGLKAAISGLLPPDWHQWGDTPEEAITEYFRAAVTVAARYLGRLPEPGDLGPAGKACTAGRPPGARGGKVE